MNNLSQHNIKQLAQQRWLWIIVLTVWLFFVNMSIVHAQQHDFSKKTTNDYQCHLCVNNFNHTPFVLSDNLTIIPLIQSSFIVAPPIQGIISVHQLTIGNRDPPQGLFL